MTEETAGLARKDDMMKSVLFALTLVAMSGSAVTAQAATAEEQAACKSDAIKYCASHIGKPAEMSQCLEEHKPDLSDACKKVVEAHGG
jgi:hypothetical protein